MSRLLSIFVQPEFEHLTTLKRQSDWCFLKYKLNITMGKTMSAIRLNIIIFLSVYIAVLLLVCLFVYMNLYVLFQIDPLFMF